MAAKNSNKNNLFFYQRFCYKADAERKHFSFFEKGKAKEFYRLPEEGQAALGDIGRLMNRQRDPALDPIFSKVRAGVKATLNLGDEQAKKDFHRQMLEDEKGRLNTFVNKKRGKLRFIDDVETTAKYNVDLPGYMTASGIMGYFYQFDDQKDESLSTKDKNEKNKRKEVLDLLKERLGATVINNIQNHPVALWAVATALETPDPPGIKKFLDTVFPAKKTALFDVDQKKKAAEDAKKNLESLEHVGEEIEHNGGKDFLKKLAKAADEMRDSKKDHDDALKNSPKSPSGATSADIASISSAYNAQIQALDKRATEAKENYKKLLDIYKKFIGAYENFFRKLMILAPPDSSAGEFKPDPTWDEARKKEERKKWNEKRKGPAAHPKFADVLQFEHHYDLEHLLEFNIETIGVNGDPAKGIQKLNAKEHEEPFQKFYEAVMQQKFQADYNPIKKHLEHDLKQLEEAETKKVEGQEGKEKSQAPYMTEQDFLYKIVHYRRTNKIQDGGLLPNNGTKLDQHQIAEKIPDSMEETATLIMEARSLAHIANADKRRMERYAQLRERSGGLFGWLRNRYPMKDLPPLDTMLRRIKILDFEKLDEKGEVVKDASGNAERDRPFKDLKLTAKTDLAKLRQMVFEKKLQKQYIPHLIGQLEAMLEGYSRYQIREKDLTPLLNLIKNLEILRVFHLRDQFKKDLAKNPDQPDLALGALWKNDLKIAEKVSEESMDRLFNLLRGDYKGDDSYKKQVETLVEEAKEKYTNKETGELDFTAAKKFLKDHGVSLALGGAGLYLAGKHFGFGEWLKKKLPKTAAEKSGKIAEAGVWRKLGYSAKEFAKNTAKFSLYHLPLTVLQSPYTFPRWLFRKAKPALDKTGVTALAGQVGKGIASGGKMAKDHLTGIYHDLKHAAEHLPSKMNILAPAGGHATH